MKKIIQLSSLTLLLASASVYAHHPAADIVDPDIYAMIDENVSDVHAAMTFDDMGGDTIDVGGVVQSRDDEVGNMGAEMGGDMEDVGAEMSGDMADVGAEMESREEMNSMAGMEPSGTMSRQR
jgi:hypothetical protein